MDRRVSMASLAEELVNGREGLSPARRPHDASP
jgi:hypothetical protein